MIGFLRFIGTFNAAIWLGSAIFFGFIGGPAFFSKEMKAVIPPPYNGLAAELLIERYFIVLHICGIIALLHAAGERLYSGRSFGRITVGVLLIIFSFGLIGGFALQPKLKALHVERYRRSATVEQKEQAETSFKRWHAVSRLIDLIVLPGLIFYFWQVTNVNQASRTIMSRRNWAGLS